MTFSFYPLTDQIWVQDGEDRRAASLFPPFPPEPEDCPRPTLHSLCTSAHTTPRFALIVSSLSLVASCPQLDQGGSQERQRSKARVARRGKSPLGDCQTGRDESTTSSPPGRLSLSHWDRLDGFARSPSNCIKSKFGTVSHWSQFSMSSNISFSTSSCCSCGALVRKRG